MSKMKHSIFKKIVVVFFVAMLLAMVISGVISFLYNSEKTVYRSSRYAQSGALAAAQVIESVDLDKLKESDTSDLYVKTRDEFRNICQSLDLEYLYLYEIASDGKNIIYVMTVASDDEKDEIVAKERGLGTIVDYKLTEQEQMALNGKEQSDPHIEDNAFGKVYSWCYPVYNDGGEAVALVGSDYSTDVLVRQVMQGTMLIILSMAAVLLLVFLSALFWMNRKLFAPIKVISNRMRDFVTDTGTNLKPLALKSGDEIQEIADSFDKMSDDIHKYLMHIEELTTERVQKNVELEVAGRIQSGIVPAETILSDKTYKVYAVAKPAKEVGGDFYDCFKNREGNICILIGDVSGKGVAAAMFMAMVKTMLGDCFRNGMSPAEALNTVNDALCKSNPEGMFATVFAAVLNPQNGEMHYANAGHTKPLLLKEDAEFLDVDSGIALGLFEDAGIIDESLDFMGDSGILIYTDGVTEAVNTDKEFFGEEHLLSAVKKERGAEQSVKTLGHAVNEFVGAAEQFDDYTVLALHYQGGVQEGINLKPELSSLPQLREAVLNAAGNDSRGKKIYLACEEVFANIVSYSGASALEVGMKKTNGGLTITFSDNGDAFNPVEVEEPEREFEDKDIGGMGISLIRQLTDSVDYVRTDDENVFTLTFHIGVDGEEKSV